MSTHLRIQREVGSWGGYWIFLALVIGLHVADEATHDFLSWYNPTVTALVHRFSWLPLPVFQFEVWLAGLILGILLLLALSPVAYRNTRWIRGIAYVLSILMIFNATGHGAASLYENRLIAGIWSSPLLFGAALLLLFRLVKTRRSSRKKVMDTRIG